VDLADSADPPLFDRVLDHDAEPSSNGNLGNAGPVLLGMVAGYYMAYIVTPFDLQWHLNSSLSRLMLQVWPTALVFCFLVGASPKSLKES